MIEKITKSEYLYADVESGKNQYGDIDLSNTMFVDARYVPAIIPSDRGNRYIEALPPPRNDAEIMRAYNKPMLTYDPEKETQLPHEMRKYLVGQLRSLRVPLPFHKELEQSFRVALEESYRNRYLIADTTSKIPIIIADESELQRGRLVGDSFSCANAGFSLIGCSGCGKSASLKILLSHYPQVLFHYDKKAGRQVQIVYLVVNCVANSNFSALYAGIGNAIDRALGITTSAYQSLIESRRSLGEKAEKIRELVELFCIGMIILDEIQLIDFESTRENSFESLMTLTNRTKVAIAVVGTEDAYFKMFTHLRTARRLGNIITGNLYCDNKQFFSMMAKKVFQYQWFDEHVELTSGMIATLFEYTHGIVDQLIGVCMYMNIDYLSAEKRPVVNEDYIKKVVTKHYRGIRPLLDSLDDPLKEKKRRQIVEKANRHLDNLLQEEKQKNFAEMIMADSPKEEQYMIMKKNIISNIRRVTDDYSTDMISAAADKVLLVTEETDEIILTRCVMRILTGKNESAKPKAKPKKTKKVPSADMVKYIMT